MLPSIRVTSERLFKDFEGKVSNNQLDEVMKEIDELKKLLEPEKKDASVIKKKMEHINQKIQELSTEMYRKVAEEQAKKQGGAGGQDYGAAPETEAAAGVNNTG